MNFNEYQDESTKTVLPSIQGKPEYFALGLCGESGEVAEKIKKMIRDGNLDTENLAKELGDVLWYLSQLSACFDLKLEEIADMNIKKLKSRQSRGKIGGTGDNR
jgi:NTP pyrophosphatase (non-canonical NTP hydrolase)